MAIQRLIVIGASAGGVSALKELVAGLRPAIQAAVLIVLHMSPRHRSLLPEILSAAGALPVANAVSGRNLETGKIYVAIPDHHLMVDGSEILVRQGPKENHHRPSIDVLFRSAAYHFGNRAIGIVLSGMLSDGSSGLFSIRRLGGTSIIQDPHEAAYRSMPLAALRNVDIDHTVSVHDMGALLTKLVEQRPRDEPTGAGRYRLSLKQEVDIFAGRIDSEKVVMQNYEPSPYTCPDCSGVLFRIPEGTQDRFRCHTGHGFSTAALAGEYFESMEAKIWESLKSMSETVMLLSEAAHRAAAAGEAEQAAVLGTTQRELEDRLATLRTLAWTNTASDGEAAPDL